MLTYCLKCRKNTGSKNPKDKNQNMFLSMLLSNCVICNSKRLRFTKNLKTSGLWSGLGINKPLINKIPIIE